MEILLWLVPSLVVTVVAMLWVSWIGRAGRGVVDRDEAVRRLGEALAQEDVVRRAVPARPRERATGVALRRPVPDPVLEDDVEADEEDRMEAGAEEERRAS